MTGQSNLRFRAKLFMGYAAVLLLMVGLTLMVYLNLKTLQKNREWVDHTHRVIALAEHCRSLLVDMETGVRGFLVAGEELFLEPYNRGIADFETSWTRGREMTLDNPSQTRRWDRLKTKQQIWLETVALPEIAMRREYRKGEAAVEGFEEISSRTTGKQIFDEIRIHLDILSKKFIKAGRYEGEKAVARTLTALLNQETGQRGFLLSGKEESLDPFHSGLRDFEKAFDTLDRLSSGLAAIRPDETLGVKLLVDRWHEKAIWPEIEARRQINEYPIRLKDVAALLEAGTGKRIMDEMRGIVDGITNEEKDLLFIRSQKSEATSSRTVATAILGTALAAVLGIFIAFFIVSGTFRQLGAEPSVLKDLTEKVAMGNLSVTFETEKDDATGVYGSVIRMVENLQDIVKQTEAVALGDFQQKIKKRSPDDQLGNALAKMTTALNASAEKARTEDYLRIGQARLGERLRGEQTRIDVADTAVRFISEYFDAQVGAFYLAAEEGLFELSASYAYEKRKSVSNRFKAGQGLVGQAAREKKPIVVTQIPEDYIRIASGLGNTIPTSILVYPVILEEKVLGILELGSTRIFTDTHIQLLDLVARSVAFSLQSAESRDQMARLLKQTQDQAEDLQTQQEELREANEILQTQKQALLKSEKQLQEQQEELRQTNEELEEQTQLLEEQKSSIQTKNMELENTRQLIEKKAKDLELTSKYKSEFLANMSHELRTPLNSILLLSKLMTDRKGSSLTPKLREYAQTIHLSGAELLDLINEILDLSKVESGKMEITLEQVSLPDMVNRFDKAFTPQAANKGLEFTTRIDPGVPDRIKTDGQRLEQIIKNLISNALKFTAEGRIGLDIHRPESDPSLEDSGLEPETSIALSVHDTGEGIEPEKRQLIFEAFQQADGTTSRKYGGSGLGLSISRELARLLGGFIRLESQSGQGSTFTLVLPEILEKDFGQTDETSALRDSGPPAGGAQQTPGKKTAAPPSEFIPDDRQNLTASDKILLIIEDDVRFARTLSDLARERGYKVLVAGDGETGLHFADFYRPDAVILDIGLPGMDGWSVMDRLKEYPKTRHIPVHFISAQDKSLEARKMGAIGFITKPVTISLLDEAFQKIEHLISKNVRNLLIVEDDDVQRKSMIDLIGNGDVDTTEAGSGEEAFGLIRSRTFDCIILDLGLPDVTGVEFLTRIKEDDTIPNVPIIVYTGKELTREEEAVINEYAEKIIVKGARSAERLVDETTLFLHRVESELPEEKRRMIRILHDRESVFNDKTVLVVDDDMRNVFAITNVLETKGLNVVAASNGKKGMEALETHPDIDLVLMDIMMPEMDGYEAMRGIREKKAFKKLPIIALTAKAMKGDRKKCIEAGASDYLAKPVNMDKLLSMMRVWLY